MYKSSVQTDVKDDYDQSKRRRRGKTNYQTMIFLFGFKKVIDRIMFEFLFLFGLWWLSCFIWMSLFMMSIELILMKKPFPTHFTTKITEEWLEGERERSSTWMDTAENVEQYHDHVNVPVERMSSHKYGIWIIHLQHYVWRHVVSIYLFYKMSISISLHSRENHLPSKRLFTSIFFTFEWFNIRMFGDIMSI